MVEVSIWRAAFSNTVEMRFVRESVKMYFGCSVYTCVICVGEYKEWYTILPHTAKKI